MHDFLFYDGLRPSGKLYETVLAGKTTFQQDMVLLDHQLYADRTHAYLLPGKGEVEATLVSVDAREYNAVLKRLDQMHGYAAYKGLNNENERSLLKFDYELEEGETEAQFGQAWLYVTSDAKREKVRQLPRVLSGDWRTWESVHGRR